MPQAALHPDLQAEALMRVTSINSCKIVHGAVREQ